jgi:RimJ/RimL family protein N-acetyltransferase
MSALPILSGSRVRLRPWRHADRAPFAAMNGDPRVMEFFRSPLSRAESDVMVDYSPLFPARRLSRV